VARRARGSAALCKKCFVADIERDVYELIVRERLIQAGDRVALCVSGGKDSTALAHIVKRLSDAHGAFGGAELHLLSIDEGIVGYRDESIATVRRNAAQYGLPLLVVSFAELCDGLTMDAIAERTAGRNTCTYCGVFRRHAFDRGALRLGCTKVATGHNADDAAETVLMNLLRGDSPRLHRCRGAQSGGEGGCLPRIKPFVGLTQREIVLYAHFERLDFFATECKYAHGAYRGNARAFIKQLEAISPSAVLDIVLSGDSFVVNGDDRDDIEDSVAPQPQQRRRCERCGYLTSQRLCAACTLIDSLNSKPAPEPPK
jgi:cytoplasmic tRNA 2-thiolation protein 1